MYEVILENAQGNRLTFVQNSPFTITDIQGLNPPEADINTSSMALIDGAKFNSAKLQMRTINIAFAIEYQAAKNRVEIYKVLRSKQPIKFIYHGQYRNVQIDGYLQSINIDYFEMKQIVTCAIICPEPYFTEAQAVINELLNIISTFHFPFYSTEEPEIVFGYIGNDVGITIDNDGDVACGMIITLNARNTVTNPKIFNYATGEKFGITYSLQAADLVTIDTRQGHKTVTLQRGGSTINLFNYIDQDSVWLQLSPDGDTFVYTVDTGTTADLAVTFNHYNLYEGV